VNIKWGKEKFENVDCNTDEPPIVFKATLFSLSGVQPDRQKVMYKGAVIKVSSTILTAAAAAAVALLLLLLLLCVPLKTSPFHFCDIFVKCH